MNTQGTSSRVVDRMAVHILESNEKLGRKAADDFVVLLSRVTADKGRAAVILATGNSQLTFTHALRVKKDIEWDKVAIFHMDEYLGMSDQDVNSFARYIREEVVNFVHPQAFYPMRGDADDIKGELQRYTSLLREHPPDVCVLGIGENGHLAFNDPPADFETKDLIHVVKLDTKCRMQQVNEGHFPRIEDVPQEAITLTVPALLSAKHVLAVVPERRKAAPVKAALEAPVTPDCPASILRTKPNVIMYLDNESASLLS